MQGQLLNQATLLARSGFTIPTLRPVSEDGATMTPVRMRELFGAAEQEQGARPSLGSDRMALHDSPNDSLSFSEEHTPSMHATRALPSCIDSAKRPSLSGSVGSQIPAPLARQHRALPDPRALKAPPSTDSARRKIKRLDLTALTSKTHKKYNFRPGYLGQAQGMANSSGAGLDLSRGFKGPGLGLDLSKAMRDQAKLMGSYVPPQINGDYMDEPLSSSDRDSNDGGYVFDQFDDEQADDEVAGINVHRDNGVGQDPSMELHMRQRVPALDLTMMQLPGQDESTEESTQEQTPNADDMINYSHHSYSHYNNGSRST